MSTTLEHTIDEELDEVTDLATLSEEQTNVVQMQELVERTIEPGLMRLPVSQVSTTEESENWAIDLEHPVFGTIRKHARKPVYGWDETDGIARLMHWYGISNRDPYYLQCEEMYVARTRPDASTTSNEWEIVPPPDYRRPWLQRVGDRLRRPTSSIEWMYTILLSSAVVGATIVSLLSLGAVASPIVMAMLFVLATLVGLMGLTPPGGGL